MDYTTLNLILVSANGLKKSRFTGKRDVYAVASISGTGSKAQKLRTTTYKNGDSDPIWNFPMKFVINEAARLQNRLTLVVKIKSVGMIIGDRTLGEVRVPIKELLDDVKTDRKTLKTVSYQVRRPSGKSKGVLSLSYEFGEMFSGKTEEPVTAYPPGMAVGSSYGNPPSYATTSGYGYPNQQPGVGYLPTAPPAQGYGVYPPPAVVPTRTKNSGMGFGTGLLGGALGGLLIGDIMSHGGGCSGGGCGGGGCGGGDCGGGGCGGGGCGGGGCGGF